MSHPPITFFAPPMRPNTIVAATKYAQGASVTELGAQFRTWAGHPAVNLIIYTAAGAVARTVAMQPEGSGFFTITDPRAGPGDLYKYQFGQSAAFPDPATRYQPFGVHGPSMVMASDFPWTDGDWETPALGDLVVYELHVGTFTPEGTFAAAIGKLPDLADLGVSAIEIMPVADFPGNRNWGYDGVCLYAPAHIYGTPDEFRSLIDAAHANGLAVILDVVYNHFGPDGNYLATFHPDYFHPTHKTPWGSAFHFDLPPVRQFFVQNIAYWIDEFHIDGFRLDATHAIVDSSHVHVLTEIADTARKHGGFVIAEDDRNDARLVTDVRKGGIGLDGCWADDFHHVINVMLTGNRDAYFKNYQGTGAELATTLQKGWLFTGQAQKTTGKYRGNDPTALRPEQLVYCISNHDQIGNRAFGERLNHLISPAAFRAASALLLLAPYTPLMFMGQDWAASTPFRYFTDHNAELGDKVTVGRRHEFRDFAAFRDPRIRESIPSPQAEETFLQSKLNWDERLTNGGMSVVNLYRTCLHLRKSLPALRNRCRKNWKVLQLTDDVVAIVYGVSRGSSCVVVADLTGSGFRHDRLGELLGCECSFATIFCSNAEEFCSDASGDAKQPQTLLLQPI